MKHLKETLKEMSSSDNKSNKKVINNILDKLAKQIKLLGLSEFTLFTNEYNDNNLIDDKEIKKIDWGVSPFSIKESTGYNNAWVINIVLRRIIIKDAHIVFDIEECYEDIHDNAESHGLWKEQEIDDILNSCDKKKVISVLSEISNTYLTNTQLAELNKKCEKSTKS